MYFSNLKKAWLIDCFLIGEQPNFVKEEISPSGKIKLYQNFPNPFYTYTTIKYFLPEPQNIHISILSILGLKITSLYDGMQASGQHKVLWNGNDISGKNMPPGIYFCVLQGKTYSLVTEVIKKK